MWSRAIVAVAVLTIGSSAIAARSFEELADDYRTYVNYCQVSINPLKCKSLLRTLAHAADVVGEILLARDMAALLSDEYCYAQKQTEMDAAVVELQKLQEEWRLFLKASDVPPKDQ